MNNMTAKETNKKLIKSNNFLNDYSLKKRLIKKEKKV